MRTRHLCIAQRDRESKADTWHVGTALHLSFLCRYDLLHQRLFARRGYFMCAPCPPLELQSKRESWRWGSQWGGSQCESWQWAGSGALTCDLGLGRQRKLAVRAMRAS